MKRCEVGVCILLIDIVLLLENVLVKLFVEEYEDVFEDYLQFTLHYRIYLIGLAAIHVVDVDKR